MLRLFSLLLITCILGQASVRTLLVLDYQFDQAAYLKNCENKDKPKLHCDGKCYLKKQMQLGNGTDSKGPQLPEGFREIKDLQLFCEPFEAFFEVDIQVEQRHPLAPYCCTFPQVLIAGIFRPPARAMC